MTVEIRPLNVKCNIACDYCYQNSLRSADNLTTAYDIGAIKSTLKEIGKDFAVFGGEPLLLSKAALEEFFALGFEEFGRNSIQTNGTLMDNDHISLFKQYNVSVGISMDGPGTLNDARWAGTLERTREHTAKTERAIERLIEEGVSTGLIITLNRINAAPDRLPVLLDWVEALAEKGVDRIRLHTLEADNDMVRQTYGLTTEENLQAILALQKLEKKLDRKFFDMFDDMKHMLRGHDFRASCVWRGCDTYNTVAVQSVNHIGMLTNCGRTTQDGVDFLKTEQNAYVRYIALYNTAHEYGGCQGCRFFLFCKGYCPGTAIDNDWRNRTEYCDLLTEMFERIEKEMVEDGEAPLSLHPERENLERSMVAAWMQGVNPTIGKPQNAPPNFPGLIPVQMA